MEYCGSIGAELPTLKDPQRLALDMGANRGKPGSSVPEVLPGLSALSNCGPVKDRLWGSSVHSVSSGFFTYLDGSRGLISCANGGHEFPVRCIARL